MKADSSGFLRILKQSQLSSHLINNVRTFSPCSHHRSVSGPAAGEQIDKAIAKQNYMNVFDRETKLLHKKRAALMENSHLYDYIKDEVGFVLADRVIDVKRNMDLILDLGCGKGHVLKSLDSNYVTSVVATDNCEEWLQSASAAEDISCEKRSMDEEDIGFESNTFNMVLSCLNLHWVNNLPKVFARINNILKPDGVFLGAMFGSNTLYELRCSLQMAELEREGGMGSHISPFAEIRDIGGLLTINGFTMLTIDTQQIKIGYPSIFELASDLKGMAENNASWKRKVRINKDTLFAADAIYREMYGNEDGTIPASFNIIYMIAWKPDPSQPQPLPQQKPDVSLKDLGKFK